MQIADLALQRNKYPHLSDDEWRWFLQQEEGRLRTADKLPSFATMPDWWYPVRLSCEQCSSEATAEYKQQIVNGQYPNGKCLDLTGGYGIDTFFLSRHFTHTDYVEQNAELCRIAEHNFALANKQITVHNVSAEAFLETTGHYDLIFLDPARRDSHGGKVFRLQDCTPNVIELLPTLIQHLATGGHIMLKLSPMLDITQALKELSSVHSSLRPSDLPPLQWDTHIVAVKNEVKEILLLSGGTGQLTAIDLTQPPQSFTFTRKEEQSAQVEYLSAKCSFSETVFQAKPVYLYEPNAAILKAGAYKLVAELFALQKLDVNTHLYASDRLIPDFPGRIWCICQTLNGKMSKSENEKMSNCLVLTRNYPLTPDQLKKKLRLRDGGTAYLIGCRIAGKPTLFLAERV